MGREGVPLLFCATYKRMRRFLPLLSVVLAAPLLLAPIRYQTGEDSVILAPAQGPASTSYALPAAVGLSSPTVITLSPTVLPEVSGTVAGTSGSTAVAAVTPTTAPPRQVVVVVAAEPLMPSTTAIVCARALKTMSDIAILSYQQQRQQASMNLVITGSLAAAEAAERHYPLLTATQEGLEKLKSNTPQLVQMRTAGALALAACKNPQGPAYNKVAPGSRIPVPRPD